VKAIESSGQDENDNGRPAMCASCIEPFDERGGVLFDARPGRPTAGLCVDCCDRVVEAVAADGSED
jgi:hypothetical protein